MGKIGEYTSEEKGWFVKPERLQALRDIWKRSSAEELLQDYIMPQVKIDFEPHMGMEGGRLDRYPNPSPDYDLSKPYIFSEIHFSYKAGETRNHPGDIDNTDLESVYGSKNGFSIGLGENWVYTRYLDHDLMRVRPERIKGPASLKHLVEGQINRERKLGFVREFQMYQGW